MAARRVAMVVLLHLYEHYFGVGFGDDTVGNIASHKQEFAGSDVVGSIKHCEFNLSLKHIYHNFGGGKVLGEVLSCFECEE